MIPGHGPASRQALRELIEHHARRRPARPDPLHQHRLQLLRVKARRILG